MYAIRSYYGLVAHVLAHEANVEGSLVALGHVLDRGQPVGAGRCVAILGGLGAGGFGVQPVSYNFV